MYDDTLKELSRFDTIPELQRLMHGQTELLYQYAPPRCTKSNSWAHPSTASVPITMQKQVHCHEKITVDFKDSRLTQCCGAECWRYVDCWLGSYQTVWQYSDGDSPKGRQMQGGMKQEAQLSQCFLSSNISLSHSRSFEMTCMVDRLQQKTKTFPFGFLVEGMLASAEQSDL